MNTHLRRHQPVSSGSSSERVEPLTEDRREAALEFLSKRPLQTVIMAGWISKYGVDHPQHRGNFYCSLDSRREISGIALIGRNLCFEASTDAALRALAERARLVSGINLMFGESREMSRFWRTYSSRKLKWRMRKTVLRFEMNTPFTGLDQPLDVRPARAADLDPIVRAHAEMAFNETGVDPLKSNPEEFRARCRERVEDGRVWTSMQNGRVVFKVDIVSTTPQAIYIEGLWVDPEYRGQKIAKRCIGAFSHQVLDGTNAICGFVRADDPGARAFYCNTGFRLCEPYAKYYV